jgi:hypothetical protein
LRAINKLLVLLLIGVIFLSSCHSKGAGRKNNYHINRKALVRRHMPSVDRADSLSPFTVGNGEFAFTADITGLQTYPDAYENGIPLCTQSQWGWHTFPDNNNYTLEQAFEYYDTYGRQVPYASNQECMAGKWLRANPHRLHLGRIGLNLLKSDSSEVQLKDIKDINQCADIWNGVIRSSFCVDNEQVKVKTCCHPDIDLVAVDIRSRLLKERKMGVSFDFPYGSDDWGKDGADWQSPLKHISEIVCKDQHSVIIQRVLDSDSYYVTICWSGDADIKRTAEHSFVLSAPGGSHFSFTCRFSKDKDEKPLPGARKTINASRSSWHRFWKTGGAIDLSESSDPRAKELERRIVLSRYLTAIQCAGSMPPQETGLTCNSWYGKFHLEMHWWHAVHFVLWGHPEKLERSMSWYELALSAARHKARRQGYEGARWQKMTAYDGRESPSAIGVFLIWQQPHPIYYAEILCRKHKDTITFNRYKDIVSATAEFMASYAHWDDAGKRYILGPPLIPAQEIYDPEKTINPALELSYWVYGLKTAQQWRERSGLPPVEKWNHIVSHLSALPENNGLYQNAETAINTFEDALLLRDHPSLLGAYGMLPNDWVDTDKMGKTLEKVMQLWNWDSTWGWDYPLMAMTAARTGRPELAVDALLMDVRKNTYLNNGHNYQDERLPVYLPGNGALLTAVAMMAAGWEGAPDIQAPGFPADGKWTVRYEGLNPLP